MSTKERFEKFITKTGPTDCWLWGGAIQRGKGYGRFALCGKNNKAHRVSYQLYVGPIPNGFTIDHLCRVRACVNPAHLEAVSTKENTLRGECFSAKNYRKTSCPAGHPYSVYVYPSGKQERRCRICANRKTNERRRKQAKVSL